MQLLLQPTLSMSSPPAQRLRRHTKLVGPRAHASSGSQVLGAAGLDSRDVNPYRGGLYVPQLDCSMQPERSRQAGSRQGQAQGAALGFRWGLVVLKNTSLVG